MTETERGAIGPVRPSRCGCRAMHASGVAPAMSASGAAEAAELRIAAADDAPPLAATAAAARPDGPVAGAAGCSGFRSRARVEGGGPVIDRPAARTRITCPGIGPTARDDAITALSDGFLTAAFDPLHDDPALPDGGTAVERVRMSEAADGVPDLLPTHAGLGVPSGDPPYLNPFGLPDDLPIHARPDASSTVVAGAFSGHVLRNLGCEAEWCRVQPLDGRAIGWGRPAHLEASGPALRAGQGAFDAVGPIPCEMGAGAPTRPCAMGVARGGDGSATLVVTKPDRADRVLSFAEGVFTGSASSEAGGRVRCVGDARGQPDQDRRGGRTLRDTRCRHLRRLVANEIEPRDRTDVETAASRRPSMRRDRGRDRLAGRDPTLPGRVPHRHIRDLRFRGLF